MVGVGDCVCGCWGGWVCTIGHFDFEGLGRVEDRGHVLPPRPRLEVVRSLETKVYLTSFTPTLH